MHCVIRCNNENILNGAFNRFNVVLCCTEYARNVNDDAHMRF